MCPSEGSAYLALTPAASCFLFGLAGEKKQLVQMTLLTCTYRCCLHCTKCDSRSVYDRRLWEMKIQRARVLSRMCIVTGCCCFYTQSSSSDLTKVVVHCLMRNVSVS